MQTTLEPEVRSVGQLLADDHAKIDKLLGSLAAMLDDHEAERAQHMFPDLSAALLRHIRLEDEVLFPALSRNRLFRPPCLCMKTEHRRIEFELAAASDAIAHGNVVEARLALRRLERLLVEHNVKEERVLYPRADAALTPAEHANLTALLR
jgi:hemerythrin superfamily protein